MAQSSSGGPTVPRLGVVLPGTRGARILAASSRAALDRPLRAGAELSVAVASDEAVLAGAFQRAAGERRGSGGPEVRVGPGTVHVALALAHPAALLPCDERRIVNRHVRPLLRALTKAGGTGGVAHFFGRDWISVKHRPAAWIGFAHERATGRAVIEAFLARETPFDLGPRASYLEKEPGTLASILGAAVAEERLADAIVEAYASAYGRVAVDGGVVPSVAEGVEGAEDVRADPPWAATVEEVIGALGAGWDARGRFRVGGDLLVSRDAVTKLEASLEGAGDEDVGTRVDASLGGAGVALDGVRSLSSVRDVILAARARRP
jgi:hypothetical protein